MKLFLCEKNTFKNFLKIKNKNIEKEKKKRKTKSNEELKNRSLN